MPIPGQTFTLPENGLGLSETAEARPLIAGCSSSGTVDTRTTVTQPQQVVDLFGQGPMPEAACRVLKTAGGPVDVIKLTAGVAGSNSAVVATLVGAATGTITLAGTPNDEYDAIVEITVTGTVGVGAFKFSLDGGTTYSSEYTIPSGGTFLIPNTGVTMTFVPGAGAVFFEDGDVHTFTCVAPHYNSTNVGTAVTALLADPGTFSFILWTGWETSGANAATLFAALDTHMTSFSNAFRYVRSIISSGNDTAANVVTAFAASTSNRISVMHGTCETVSGKPFEGWGEPALPTSVLLAARAAKAKLSEDPGRVASGALVGASNPSHDEFLTETLDQHKIGTVRTYIGQTGIFITNAWLKSQAGSDYRYWQHGRIMDVACAEVYAQQARFISAEPRTNSDGTIYELDARGFETDVDNGLNNKLRRPKNASGVAGHVSDLSYSIDRTIDLLSTQTIESNVAVRPLGYPKFIETTLGYSSEV